MWQLWEKTGFLVENSAVYPYCMKCTVFWEVLETVFSLYLVT
jgi:hypothetical protein